MSLRTMRGYFPEGWRSNPSWTQASQVPSRPAIRKGFSFPQDLGFQRLGKRGRKGKSGEGGQGPTIVDFQEPLRRPGRTGDSVAVFPPGTPLSRSAAVGIAGAAWGFGL